MNAEFFNRPARRVARELLGKFLARRENGRTLALMITEVEAYDGWQDRASHAHRGQTERNAPMFAGGGIWYVYFVYGMHWMLNAVTGPPGYPAAVLIRGLEGLPGPARLTRSLKIDRRFNARPISRRSRLWIEDRGVRLPAGRIRRLPRVGVAYAGEWAKKPYRFVVKETKKRSGEVTRNSLMRVIPGEPRRRRDETRDPEIERRSGRETE